LNKLNIKNKGLSTILVSALLSMGAAHADTKVTVISQAGFDTNPYRFNDQYAIDSAAFTSINIKGKTTVNKYWSIKAGANYQWYNDNKKWANNSLLDLAVGYKKGGYYNEVGGTANIKSYDKTYVSRLQGSTDSYSGVSLDDRYDFKQFAISAYKSMKITKGIKNTFKINYKHKNYSDFDQINITDYDHQSIRIHDEIAFRTSKKVHQTIKLAYELRPFINREKKNITGDEISNTNMIFNYYSAGYEYKIASKKSISWKMTADYKIRQDNASGYYNSQWANLGLTSKFKIGTQVKMRLSYDFSQFAYDRTPEVAVISNEEEYVDESKHSVTVESKIRLPNILDQRTYLEIDYQLTQADSNRSSYQYERQTVMTGIKVIF